VALGPKSLKVQAQQLERLGLCIALDLSRSIKMRLDRIQLLAA